MRQLFTVLVAGLTSATLWAAAGDEAKVEVKGPHICCGQCVKVVNGILGKVEGVSEVKADAETKTITFTAKDSKAVAAGLKAITNGGFFGEATSGGKEIKLKVAAAKKGDKADTVSIKSVHVCCGACQTAIKGLFKDAKVSFEGPKGPQKTVKIEGSDLDKGEILDALRKAGFNGTVEK